MDLQEAISLSLNLLRYKWDMRAMAHLQRRIRNQVAAVFREQAAIFFREMEKKGLVKESARVLVEAPPPAEVEAAAGAALAQAFLETSMPLAEAIFGGYEAAAVIGGDGIMGMAKVGMQWSIHSKATQDHLTSHAAERVSGINETTRDTIRDIISDGYAEDKSYSQIAKEIRDTFDEFSTPVPQAHIRDRAELIAVTEMAEGHEYGANQAVQALAKKGFTVTKGWLNVGDGRVCPMCQENQDEGWIPLDQPFPSGHDYPPGHPGCRCTTKYDFQ